jgi:hypothetical protein
VTAFSDEASGPPRRVRALADPFYYLNNFERVIASLDARYAPLWSAQERHFIGDFATLPRASRALLVRMVIRKGELFRDSRLRYAEIGPTCAAVAPLIERGWVERQSSLEIDELAHSFTKPQLLDHFALPGVGRNLGKAQLIGALRAQHPHPVSLQTWQRVSGDCIYRLRVAALCDQLRLMFFGNFHQDWSEFVLADLGLMSYEKIQDSLQSAAFASRRQLDALLRLDQCRRLLDAETEPALIDAQMPPPIEDCDWIEELRQRLLFQIARAHERRGDRASALRGYAHCRHRGARMRAVRIHERAGQWATAHELCRAAHDAPESALESQEVRRVLPRLNRKLGVREPPPPPDLPSFELEYRAMSAPMSVEHYVREQLILEGGRATSVHYVENSLVLSLFGLLCWQAIFEPIPGAFFHDYQHGPADLSSARFVERRRGSFAECFARLDTDEYQTAIRRCFADKAGIQSPFVSWASLSRSLLDLALACFPPAHLRLWFEWIVADLQDNRAGFPDLVQFWPGQRRYRLVEVKGPGDRLQDNQRRLLEFCVAWQMPVAVCYVRLPADVE